MSEKIYEGFWDSMMAAAKKGVYSAGAIAGSQRSKGKLDAQNVADHLYNGFQHYLGTTGQEVTPETLSTFLKDQIGFSPEFSDISTRYAKKKFGIGADSGVEDSESIEVTDAERIAGQQGRKSPKAQEKKKQNEPKQRVEPSLKTDSQPSTQQAPKAQQTPQTQQAPKAQQAAKAEKKPEDKGWSKEDQSGNKLTKDQKKKWTTSWGTHKKVDGTVVSDAKAFMNKGTMPNGDTSDGRFIYRNPKTVGALDKELNKINQQDTTPATASGKISQYLSTFDDAVKDMKANGYLAQDAVVDDALLAKALAAAQGEGTGYNGTFYDDSTQRFIIAPPVKVEESINESIIMEKISDGDLRKLFKDIGHLAFRNGEAKAAARGELTLGKKPSVDYSKMDTPSKATEPESKKETKPKSAPLANNETPKQPDAETNDVNDVNQKVEIELSDGMNDALEKYTDREIIDKIKSDEEDIEILAQNIMFQALSNYRATNKGE
jgi:hypothetical protein